MSIRLITLFQESFSAKSAEANMANIALQKVLAEKEGLYHENDQLKVRCLTLPQANNICLEQINMTSFGVVLICSSFFVFLIL